MRLGLFYGATRRVSDFCRSGAHWAIEEAEFPVWTALSSAAYVAAAFLSPRAELAPCGLGAAGPQWLSVLYTTDQALGSLMPIAPMGLIAGALAPFSAPSLAAALAVAVVWVTFGAFAERRLGSFWPVLVAGLAIVGGIAMRVLLGISAWGLAPALSGAGVFLLLGVWDRAIRTPSRGWAGPWLWTWGLFCGFAIVSLSVAFGAAPLTPYIVAIAIGWLAARAHLPGGSRIEMGKIALPTVGVLVLIAAAATPVGPAGPAGIRRVAEVCSGNPATGNASADPVLEKLLAFDAAVGASDWAALDALGQLDGPYTPERAWPPLFTARIDASRSAWSAREALEQGESRSLEAAAQRVSQAAWHEPFDLEVRRASAMVLLAAGRAPDALEVLNYVASERRRRTPKDTPDERDEVFVRVIALMRLGRLDQARAELGDALRRYPDGELRELARRSVSGEAPASTPPAHLEIDLPPLQPAYTIASRTNGPSASGCVSSIVGMATIGAVWYLFRRRLGAAWDRLERLALRTTSRSTRFEIPFLPLAVVGGCIAIAMMGRLDFDVADPPWFSVGNFFRWWIWSVFGFGILIPIGLGMSALWCFLPSLRAPLAPTPNVAQERLVWLRPLRSDERTVEISPGGSNRAPVHANYNRHLLGAVRTGTGREVIAVGNPSDFVVPGGPAWVYEDESSQPWTETVQWLVKGAAGVILDLGDSAGILWELELVAGMTRRGPTLVFLWVPSDAPVEARQRVVDLLDGPWDASCWSVLESSGVLVVGAGRAIRGIAASEALDSFGNSAFLQGVLLARVIREHGLGTARAKPITVVLRSDLTPELATCASAADLRWKSALWRVFLQPFRLGYDAFVLGLHPRSWIRVRPEPPDAAGLGLTTLCAILGSATVGYALMRMIEPDGSRMVAVGVQLGIVAFGLLLTYSRMGVLIALRLLPIWALMLPVFQLTDHPHLAKVFPWLGVPTLIGGFHLVLRDFRFALQIRRWYLLPGLCALLGGGVAMFYQEALRLPLMLSAVVVAFDLIPFAIFGLWALLLEVRACRHPGGSFLWALLPFNHYEPVIPWYPFLEARLRDEARCDVPRVRRALSWLRLLPGHQRAAERIARRIGIEIPGYSE